MLLKRGALEKDQRLRAVLAAESGKPANGDRVTFAYYPDVG